MSFDYANLSEEKIKDLKELEDKHDVVLIAFDSKYKDKIEESAK
ncbi:hypothetical protein [Pontibacillus marinus]|uniref:Uncharacterized protein n=1 Tax=Pontibacillus marinus BH030004 = DSM 16465 TaxID=1385511 RepID=A0A0A5GGD4_9BACI|nr:hypothetical protein [Pontibacillus marinus]KGX90175.1 hypothetical protein N783_01400 [Pontibacillus marinus BH030004 = DSM 16465]